MFIELGVTESNSKWQLEAKKKSEANRTLQKSKLQNEYLIDNIKKLKHNILYYYLKSKNIYIYTYINNNLFKKNTFEVNKNISDILKDYTIVNFISQMRDHFLLLIPCNLPECLSKEMSAAK